MITLLKYELLAKYKRDLFCIGLAVVANVVFLISLGNIGFSALPLIILFLIMFFCVLLTLVTLDLLIFFSRDLNSKEGYMLFLTPYDSYTILAARLLGGFLRCLAFLLIFAFLVYFDIFRAYGASLNAIWHFISSQLDIADQLANQAANVFLSYILLLICFTLVFVMLTMAAMSLRRGLLANLRAGWFFTILISITLFILTNVIKGRLISAMQLGFGDLLVRGNDWNVILPLATTNLLASSLIYTIFFAVFFWLCGLLLNKRVEL
jgi:hypothetical protein